MHPPSLAELGFPEALRWRDGELWFSDMFRGRILRWRPGSTPGVVLDTDRGGPSVPGGLGWLPDGDLLVVDCEGRRLLRLDSAAIEAEDADAGPSVYADLGGILSHPANDLHVDIDGTAWVGSYGFDPEADTPAPSQLVRVDTEGIPRAWGDRLVFPNGCERASDGSLVVAETFADRVSILDAGGHRRTLVDLPPGAGPDGLSIGAHGTVFVALAFSGEVVAVVPGGAVTVIHRPAAISTGPGAGPIGCYDCAVTRDGRWLAVATASQDEGLAARVDTGVVTLIRL